MYIGIISDECESFDILCVVNSKSEMDWSIVENYYDLHNFLAPEIIELCDPVQMKKFKKEYAKGIKDLTEFYEIPGKIDVPYIDKELLKSWCIIDDRTNMIPDQPFFEINCEVGLTDEDAKKVIKYFKDFES